jgi:hypothetical protein
MAVWGERGRMIALETLAAHAFAKPRRLRKTGEQPRQVTMLPPAPGDAVAVSPIVHPNGVASRADAGRLLSITANEHGTNTATYHSTATNSTQNSPASALARLEEGADADESTHPNLKIVPLRLGDTKHVGRSVIFHGGAAVGTVDPAKVGPTKIVSVSMPSMGEDRHFVSRKDAIKAIHDHLEPEKDDVQKEKANGAGQQPTEKAKKMTVADLFNSSGPRTVADLLKSAPMEMAPSSAVRGDFIGSYEDTLRRIRGPICLGSGCDNKPKYDDAGNRIYGDEGESSDRKYPHYLDVVATFPEHAYVRCSDEDRLWKVPYEFDGDEVTTGEPEIVVAQFVPIEDATGEVTDGLGGVEDGPVSD